MAARANCAQGKAGGMEWTPPTLMPKGGGNEVDPRGPTASKVPSGEASASRANRRVRDEG